MKKISKKILTSPIFIFLFVLILFSALLYFLTYRSESINLPLYPNSVTVEVADSQQVDEAIIARANCGMATTITSTLLATTDSASQVYDYYNKIADNFSRQGFQIVKGETSNPNYSKTICYNGKSNNFREVPRTGIAILDPNNPSDLSLIKTITVSSNTTIILILEGEFIGD